MLLELMVTIRMARKVRRARKHSRLEFKALIAFEAHLCSCFVPLSLGNALYLVLASIAWLWRVNPEIFAARRRMTGEGTKSWDES